MDYAGSLRRARRRAGLTQRELAERTGIPQPAISRIESARVVPSVGILDRLLRACGEQLEAVPRIGDGVDVTLIRRMLKLTAAERLERLTQEARNLESLMASKR